MMDGLLRLVGAAPKPCQSCELRSKTIAHMSAQATSRQHAHAGLSRRVSRLQQDHPEIWRLYFTKAGDEERNAKKVP